MALDGFGIASMQAAYRDADELDDALAFSQIDLAGVLAQRKVLADALRSIDPNHPAIHEARTSYSAAVRAAAPRHGLHPARVDAWLRAQK